MARPCASLMDSGNGIITLCPCPGSALFLRELLLWWPTSGIVWHHPEPGIPQPLPRQLLLCVAHPAERPGPQDPAPVYGCGVSPAGLGRGLGCPRAGHRAVLLGPAARGADRPSSPPRLEGSSCSYDAIDVYDGGSPEGWPLGRVCRNDHRVFNSSGNQLTVLFRSDGSVSRRGFHAYYSSFLAFNSTVGKTRVVLYSSPGRKLKLSHKELLVALNTLWASRPSLWPHLEASWLKGIFQDRMAMKLLPDTVSLPGGQEWDSFHLPQCCH